MRVILQFARLVELVDTLALGASALRHEGSSPLPRTRYYSKAPSGVFFFDVIALDKSINLVYNSVVSLKLLKERGVIMIQARTISSTERTQEVKKEGYGTQKQGTMFRKDVGGEIQLRYAEERIKRREDSAKLTANLIIGGGVCAIAIEGLKHFANFMQSIVGPFSVGLGGWSFVIIGATIFVIVAKELFTPLWWQFKDSIYEDEIRRLNNLT